MPPTSWNLRDLKDTRENVAEAVQNAAFVPDIFKAAIGEAIDQHDAKARLIRLDAHCHVIHTKDKGMVQNLTITIATL